MDNTSGNIRIVFTKISRQINHDELLELKFLCRSSKDKEETGHWNLDDLEYSVATSQAETNHIVAAISVLTKRDREEIHSARDLFTKLHEVTGKDFNSVQFLKPVILLLRTIHREDLVKQLMPFLRWSCQNSCQSTPTGSRRCSMNCLPTQVSVLNSDSLQTDSVDLEEAKKALDEISDKPVPKPRTPLPGGDFPMPALIFFIFIFMMPSFNSMVYVYDNYIHPPATVKRDHTDTPIEADKELLGRPVLFGLIRPAFPDKHDLSLHAQNVRSCLAKHKRCLIKGYFGEGKSHTLSMYIHESIGKYPAGIIWLREWKDIVAAAGVIASHRGTDIVIRREAASAYLQDFLWNTRGWLLLIQDEHLWDSNDFKRVLNLFLNLESDVNHVIITSHRIPEVLHDSIKVYEFNSGVHFKSGLHCHSMVEEVLSNSISLTDKEKQRLLPIMETASCNQYALKRITNFINEWNFTIEGFVAHWNEMTKREWLEMLGFGPKSDALLTEMKILVDLKEQHPAVMNFVLDYIKTGKIKHEIPECKLHDRYKGEPLLFILAKLRDLSLADIVIKPDERLCSVQMPSLLRLLIEVTFLMKEDRVERVLGAK
ncbi:uncharacterized protein LOC135485878 [Lineus longissimus]|uniref:uncharacterized protein LOC135485878 n=1 Tax=Lineus longissimus TaxID=88925 RepID=UPI00315CD769